MDMSLASGIPQGSFLGPILFTIYINDLPDVVKNVAKLFADDTKLYTTVNNTNDEIKLQGDIDWGTVSNAFWKSRYRI
jgi:hypothetical protein